MAALFFYLKVASQVAPLHPRCQKRTDRAVRKTETSLQEKKLHASGKRRRLKLQFLTKSIHQQKLNSGTSPPGQKRVFFKQ